MQAHCWPRCVPCAVCRDAPERREMREQGGRETGQPSPAGVDVGVRQVLARWGRRRGRFSAGQRADGEPVPQARGTRGQKVGRGRLPTASPVTTEGPEISALEMVFHRVGRWNESVIFRGNCPSHPLKVSDEKSCFSVPWYVPGTIPSPLPRSGGSGHLCLGVHAMTQGGQGGVPRWHREEWLSWGRQPWNRVHLKTVL